MKKRRLNCRSIFIEIYRQEDEEEVGDRGDREEGEKKKKTDLSMSSVKRPLLISFNATRIYFKTKHKR